MAKKSNGSTSLKAGIITRKQLYDFLKKKGVDGKSELEKGIKVEMEHESDPKHAERIAFDHLVEFPRYYIHLEVMEETLKAERETGRECHVCCGRDTEKA